MGREQPRQLTPPERMSWRVPSPSECRVGAPRALERGLARPVGMAIEAPKVPAGGAGGADTRRGACAAGSVGSRVSAVGAGGWPTRPARSSARACSAAMGSQGGSSLKQSPSAAGARLSGARADRAGMSAVEAARRACSRAWEAMQKSCQPPPSDAERACTCVSQPASRQVGRSSHAAPQTPRASRVPPHPLHSWCSCR